MIKSPLGGVRGCGTGLGVSHHGEVNGGGS
jgi:hypothetical protein